MAYVTKLIETYPGFGPTIVTDGSMETDPITNWPEGPVGNPNVTIQTANVHGGCQSLQVQANNPNEYIYQDVTVVPGHRYRFGVWALQGAVGDLWLMRIRRTTGMPLWCSNWFASAAWEEKVKFYRIPDGVTMIRLCLEVAAAGDVIYFDDVTFKREAPVPMAEIDLMFRAVDDWSLWNQGIRINDPVIKEIWGGELEDQLVRREEGKRVIPMELSLLAADADTLIDDVNELEKMLRHAAAFRMEGKRSGYGEVFLEFAIDTSAHKVWYPVIVGQLDKTALMKLCGSEKEIDKVSVVIVCEARWESLYTYDLENLLDNPGFEEWNAGICDSVPDCWADDSDAAGAGENNQETEIVEEGCDALRIETLNAGPNLFQGIRQRIDLRLQFDTEYTLLAWVQNEVIANGKIQVYAEGSNSGIIYALDSGAANADYTLYSCQFIPNFIDLSGGGNWFRIRVRIQAGAGGACTGIARIDKILVMEASNVPTGWMSCSYLKNHYDRHALDINFLSVCDIPGEVDAEVSYDLGLVEGWGEIRTAKRIRNNPCKFKWQLVPCEGYTTAEGGAGGACQPGLTDAACIDTNKIIDANSPSGSRITCTFAGNQAMALRAYWNINADFMSYYGRYVLAVLAAKSANTDVVKMRVQAYNPISVWSQGYILEETIAQTAANEWGLYDGWNLFSFPIGQHNDDLWDIGDRWQIRLYASITGAAAWDELWIAGVYLIPVDDAYVVGGPPGALFGADHNATLKDLDGDRGLMARSVASNRYYNDVGAVGQIPLLTPEIENYLYFIINENAVAIADPLTISLKYRPRGIFLRGTNP